jgi:hypothetical protein
MFMQGWSVIVALARADQLVVAAWSSVVSSDAFVDWWFRSGVVS